MDGEVWGGLKDGFGRARLLESGNLFSPSADRLRRPFISNIRRIVSTTKLLSILDRFNFSNAGEILLVGDRLTFHLTRESIDTGLVYLWMEISETSAVVVYVGKAGRTLQIRCNQHKAGFKNSVTGKAHAKRIRSGLSEGRRYMVYARKSAMDSILEESAIPMACVEELAFIQKLRPLWNAKA